MTSERAQRRIERLLDRIDAAEEADDWRAVSILSQNVLAVDPENAEATAYLEAAERWLAETAASGSPPLPAGDEPSLSPSKGEAASIVPPLPTAGEGRGEGVPQPFKKEQTP